MPNCQDMKIGQVYVCPQCGFEIKVIEECTREHSKDTGHNECEKGLTCCGQPLKLKK